MAIEDVWRQGKTPASGADEGSQAIIDSNLKAALALNIPYGAGWTLNGAKEKPGYVRLNTSINKFGIYLGGSNWVAMSSQADLDALITALALETSNRISGDNTLQAEVDLKADISSIVSNLPISYADLGGSGTTYTNTAYAGKTVTIFDVLAGNFITDGSGNVPFTFNGSGVLTLPFAQDPAFKGLIIGVSGVIANKFPIATSSAYNNSDRKILDINLYNVDTNDTYYIAGIGWDAGNNWYQIIIKRFSDNTEVMRLQTVNYSGVENEYRPVLFKSITHPTYNRYAVITMKISKSDVYTTYAMGDADAPVIDKSCIHNNGSQLEVSGSQEIYDNSSIISNETDLYAHEASVQVTQKNTLVVFSVNEFSVNESVAKQSAVLVRINHITGVRARFTIATFGQNYTTLITLADSYIAIPRMFIMPNGTIRIYFTYFSAVGAQGIPYYRDFDEATGTFTNPTEFKAIISGGVVPVTLNAANLQAHIEAVTGQVHTYFNSMNFYFNNDTQFHDIGDGNIYAMGQTYGSAGGAARIPLFMQSADSGATWSLKGAIYVGKTSPPVIIEPSLVRDFDNSIWYAVVRDGDSLRHATSADNGVTWTATAEGIFLNGGFYRTSTHQYKLADNLNRTLVVYNFPRMMVDDVVGPITWQDRTCLFIESGTSITKMSPVGFFQQHDTCHYPCIVVNRTKAYLAYTTAENSIDVTKLKSAIRLTIIPIAKLITT